MRRNLSDILACPTCHGGLTLEVHREVGEHVEDGALHCSRCAQSYPILRGIPRFVPSDNYAASFGLQWNRYRTEQIDAQSGVPLSEERFRHETGWSEATLKGKLVLEAGCGAGRFLEVASRLGAQVVGLDLSSAVDAAHETLRSRPNVHLVQADLFRPPFRTGVFQATYSLGVLQHTPRPYDACQGLARVLAPGGLCALTVYESNRFTKLHGKYLARRVTTRVPRELLSTAVETAMPVLFPVTDVLFRLPAVGRLFRFAIPVANWVDEARLSREQRYRWALLDTFDALAPAYDEPLVESDLRQALVEAGFVEVSRNKGKGLNVVAVRSGTP